MSLLTDIARSVAGTQTTLRKFKALFGEVTGDYAWSPHYEFGAKGWGPRRVDCSGRVQGILRRLGLLSHQEPWRSAQQLHDMRDSVSDANAQPGDLRFYGSSSAHVWHVTFVLVPGYLMLDSGGGGSESHPDGSDWPTKGRALRFLQWDRNMGSSPVGLGRIRGQLVSDDAALLREWVAHVAAWRRGERVELSEALQAEKYSPMWARE